MSDIDAFWRAFFIAMGAVGGVGWGLLVGLLIAGVIVFVAGMIDGVRR